MSEVITGDLAEPVDRPLRFLPPAVSRELAESIAAVLVFAQARGLDADVMADRVVVLIAPLLVDKDFQLEQVRAALSALVDDAARLAEIAGQRAEQMRRLRSELWLALADAEGFRALTPQVCPAGNAHTGWYAPSNGVQHPCPWCLIDELRGDGQARPDGEMAEALVRVRRMVATDSRDWGRDRSDAWLWGLLVGWDCEDQHEHGDDCASAISEIADRFGWTAEVVERLRRYRRAFATAAKSTVDGTS